MLASLALVASLPAHALDLTLQFNAEPARAATVTDLTPDSPAVLALADGQGDSWLVELALLDQHDDKLTIEGKARLVDVSDPALVQPFHLDLQLAREATVRLSDPQGRPRSLAIRATPGADAPEVECEVLVTPTVQQLADSLQSFVDAGLEPRTGSGEFDLGDEQRAGIWVCGW